MLSAILNNELHKVDFRPNPIFRVLVPESVPDVEDRILNPRDTWDDKNAYDFKAAELVKLFKNNFVKYENFGDYANSGPV